MSHCDQSLESLQWIKQEVPSSKHIPLSHFLDASTFELEQGQIGGVIHFEGIPFQTASSEELDQFRRLKHAMILELNESFAVYEYIFRSRLNVSLEGTFSDEFTAQLDADYRAKFEQKKFYKNELYLVLLYRGPGQIRGHWKNIHTEKIKIIRQAYREKAQVELHRVLRQMLSTLSGFAPRLLGEKDEQLGYSELMTFWSRLINGLNETKFCFPRLFPPLLKGVLAQHSGTMPVGKASQYVVTHRFFFGEVIEFRGPHGASKFAQILSLRTYPRSTQASMLDVLLHLDAEFICSNVFLLEKSPNALGKIDRHRVKMRNTKDRAQTQMAELEKCQDQLASGHLRMGYHNHTLLLLSDGLETLKSALNQAISAYTAASFSIIVESLGLEAAFWAQFPGNQAYLFRTAFISSENYVDFCPLHNYRTGYWDQNHLGKAVSLLETPARTPLFFNFHAKGSGKSNDLTPGHTTIIGGNGSGKTVFMGFMDSQLTRYGGKSYFFDRDRGMEIYIRATGGSYSVISPTHLQSSGFNPFSLSDSPGNRSFLKTWLKHLVRLEEEEILDSSIEKMLSDAVDYAFEALSPEYRFLSRIVQILPNTFPRWDRLRQWLRAEGKHPEGEYAYLFDNKSDVFVSSHSKPLFKMGFDLTELLNESKEVLTAVCMVLMHRIKSALEGSRVSIFFDEGWQILDNPYWKSQLKQDLPTFRKMNAHLILATQSPESILNSSLSAQFLDNAATHIFFCNPNANFEKHYRHFHISPAEFEFISKTSPGLRWFLYKQGAESSICRLNLSGMDSYLAVYSANKSSIQWLDEIRAEVGDEPQQWLPLFYQKFREG